MAKYDFNFGTNIMDSARSIRQQEADKLASQKMADVEFEITMANKLGGFRGAGHDVVDAEHAEVFSNPDMWSTAGFYTPEDFSPEAVARAEKRWTSQTDAYHPELGDSIRPDTVHITGGKAATDDGPAWTHEFGHRAKLGWGHRGVYELPIYLAKTKEQYRQARINHGNRYDMWGDNREEKERKLLESFKSGAEHEVTAIKRINKDGGNYAVKDEVWTENSDIRDHVETLNDGRYWTKRLKELEGG